MSNTESNLNPVEPEPTEIFFKKDPVSALSNVEPVVDERANPQSSAPQANREQLDEIFKSLGLGFPVTIDEAMEQNLLFFESSDGHGVALYGLDKVKSDLLAWNKATVIEAQLSILREVGSLIAPDKHKEWSDRIAELSKEQA